MTIRSFVIIFSFFVFFFTSCTNEQLKQLEASPVAIGKTNEIVIVADQQIWDGPVGDSLRYYFETPYFLLPQPEPIFDLRHFTMDELKAEPLRKHLRTYLVLADLQNDDSSTTKEAQTDLRAENLRRAKEDKKFSSTAGRNKWAQGQLLIYLFAYGEPTLMDNIRKNFPVIAKKVQDFDKKQIRASTYVMGENNSADKTIKETFGFTLKIPSDYKLAVQDSCFFWLRNEKRETSSNIMLYKIPYTDKSQLTKAGIKEIRNQLGKKYITTDIKGAYMQINDVSLPMFTENIRINGQFGIEARGIWDIENDFMGGPFISYLVLNSNTNELYFLDGFVHAPGKEKRNYMQYLELIFKSLKF